MSKYYKPSRQTETIRYRSRLFLSRFHPARRSSTLAGDSQKPSSNRKKEFVPQSLRHPLGLPHPPSAGQNTGINSQTLRQRKHDFLSQDKHMERRALLVREFSKPYFGDWTRMRYQKGKTFVSNSHLFKGDKALYFPNLKGRTLDLFKPLQDTTPVLAGKISVVSIFSSLWAERQAASFVGLQKNPALHQMIQESNLIAQRVEINSEDNWLKAFLVRCFMGSMRRNVPQEQHKRYFLVTKGFTNYIRDQIGFTNGKVGYVYLLDDMCRIRWAGSSIATPSEIKSLNDGLRKLIEEKRPRAR
ncbi:Mitochondrial ATPase complex subunit atp10 [Ophidiomyces ophidiicola]|nr:Mitochondrial ATPase complex subunit atp10 [Ophidiomyces ophidiicola]KAI1977373.1 Mitochondrial ATPase complex subunit atp10 [Ophidiomyces ophidiicola]KAI1985919.1 Mitochondrial ATPase complex subunit atp10 [Ophidiomyces ophidiicola]KAI1997096.1 Mitochondrial ATPase complex subunit atp10 [Ophidiomyces ophidiicola]